MKHRPYLVVEDDALDAKALREAFSAAAIPNELVLVRSAEAALEKLKDPTEARLRPNLILMDLSLPGMSGLELLAELKRDRELALVPAILLSSSDRPEDCRAAYLGGAAGFMVKPVQTHRFREMVAALHAYWQRCERPR